MTHLGQQIRPRMELKLVQWGPALLKQNNCLLLLQNCVICHKSHGTLSAPRFSLMDAPFNWPKPSVLVPESCPTHIPVNCPANVKHPVGIFSADSHWRTSDDVFTPNCSKESLLRCRPDGPALIRPAKGMDGLARTSLKSLLDAVCVRRLSVPSALILYVIMANTVPLRTPMPACMHAHRFFSRATHPFSLSALPPDHLCHLSSHLPLPSVHTPSSHMLRYCVVLVHDVAELRFLLQRNESRQISTLWDY